MTVDFVAQHADKPWFVNMWLNDVHDPWAPDDDSLSEVMGKGSDSDDDRYLATIVKMDKTLGKLFDRLDQMGEMDNTLVIVTADNGPSSLQRSEEHTSELQSLMRNSYAVFCLKKKNKKEINKQHDTH